MKLRALIVAAAIVVSGSATALAENTLKYAFQGDLMFWILTP